MQRFPLCAPVRDELVAICRSIYAGEIQPRWEAARIWRLLAEADYPSELDEFRVFVGAVSEMQDHPQHETAYAENIRAEARAVIDRARQTGGRRASIRDRLTP